MMRESSILISWSFLCPNGTIFNQESIQTYVHSQHERLPILHLSIGVFSAWDSDLNRIKGLIFQ